MKLIRWLPVFLLCAFSANGWSDGLDAITAACGECHGKQGNSDWNEVPTIAGQPPAYIRASLRAYRQWERPCVKVAYPGNKPSRPETNMCRISEALSDKEIEALSRYYAAQEFKAAKQPFDRALAEIGGDLHEIHCETCHAMGGSVAARGPRLGGQWAPYLRTAITQALSGEHLVPPVMESRLTEFSTQDINALVNFYASQQ